MTKTVTYQDTRSLAIRSSAALPTRCHRCGVTRHAGQGWRVGYDDGTDPHYVGLQCNNCGGVTGTTRSAILRRIRTAEKRGW